MHTVVGIAIFNAGHDENLVRTRLRTRSSILFEASGGEATIVFRHHQHPAATLPELGAQCRKRPASIVGPLRVHMTNGKNFHGFSVSVLEQVAFDCVANIGEKYLLILAPPVV